MHKGDARGWFGVTHCEASETWAPQICRWTGPLSCAATCGQWFVAVTHQTGLALAGCLRHSKTELTH